MGRPRGRRLLQGATLTIVLGLVVAAMFSETEMFKLYNEATQMMSSLIDSVEIGPVTSNTATSPKEQQQPLPINVIFALCGDHAGFFGEFKVALKSLLLNSPHIRDTHIHIMADQKAYDALPTVWNEINIDGVEWWRNITIIAYNVEPQLNEWARILKEGTGLKAASSSHTVGTYFRLFANKILPSDVEYALYIDTDVVFLANVAHLFENLPHETPEKPAPLFVMAKDCAGVMLVNVGKLDAFWGYVNAIKWSKAKLQFKDQSMVIGVGEHYPGTVEILPAAWDLTLAEHFNKARNPARLVGFRPEAGIFHYNGGAASKNAYYDGKFVNNHPDGFGLPAIFYRDLPWPWVRFMGKSVGAPANTGVRIKDNSQSIKWIKKSDHMVETQLFLIPEGVNNSQSSHNAVVEEVHAKPRTRRYNKVEKFPN